jgi:hypothetical protein
LFLIPDYFFVMIATAKISAAAKRKTFVCWADMDAWVIPFSEPLALAKSPRPHEQFLPLQLHDV